jgi:hypothetical protein
MSIEGKRDALYPGYVLPDADAVFKALHADAYMRTTPENVEDVMDAVRRVVEAAPASAQPDRGAAPAFWYNASAKVERMDLIDGAHQAHLLVCNQKFGDYTTPLYTAAVAPSDAKDVVLLDALELIAKQSLEGSGSTGTAGWFGAIARAAISATQQGAKGKDDAANAGDCKLVPVEPTVEMRNACYEEYHRPGATYTSMCRAIIAAAPGQSPATSAADAKGAERVTYTCKGKGGVYELIGVAYGAGTSRGTIVNLYREAEIGVMYFRTPADFHDRMERIDAAMAAAPSGEKGAA